jgi:hypothetical protein
MSPYPMSSAKKDLTVSSTIDLVRSKAQRNRNSSRVWYKEIIRVPKGWPLLGWFGGLFYFDLPSMDLVAA